MVTTPQTNQKTAVIVSHDFKFYAHHRNYWLNGLAIAYILGGYGFSIFCITTDTWWLNLLGTILLVHTLMWSAYFAHECFHHNIFARLTFNVVLGEMMLFLTGSCYSRYRDLAHHHITHHVHKVDLSPFSPRTLTDFLKSLPAPIRKLILCLELLYFPAMNLIIRWMIAISPFFGHSRRDERVRNASLLLLRGALFASLAVYAPHAVLLYFIAYLCFLNITQFLECFQHTFPVFAINSKIPKYSQEHEEVNTYTITCSRGWLDLLIFLNHNYHNAHHQLMSCPWYLLSQLDAKLYPSNYQQRIPAWNLLGNYFYFSYRIQRLFQGQGTVEKTEKGDNFDNFVGATGLSFMLLRTPFDGLKLSNLGYLGQSQHS